MEVEYPKELLRTIRLSNGMEFVTRRPLFRELAVATLLPVPGQEPGPQQPPIRETKPAQLVQAEAQESVKVLVEIENLMVKTAVKPRIVPDGEPKRKDEIYETQALPYAVEYFQKLTEAHFGEAQAALAPFRQEARRDSRSTGATVRKDAT